MMDGWVDDIRLLVAMITFFYVCVCVCILVRKRERERAHTYVFFIPLGSVIMPQLVGFVASSSTFTSQSSSSVPSVQLRGDGRIHWN